MQLIICLARFDGEFRNFGGYSFMEIDSSYWRAPWVLAAGTWKTLPIESCQWSCSRHIYKDMKNMCSTYLTSRKIAYDIVTFVAILL